MLSAPSKSVRRFSSLFSLGAFKDSAPVSDAPPLPSRSSEQLPFQSTRQEQQPILNHSASAQHPTAAPAETVTSGNVSSTVPTEHRFDGLPTPPASKASPKPVAGASSDN